MVFCENGTADLAGTHAHARGDGAVVVVDP